MVTKGEIVFVAISFPGAAAAESSAPSHRPPDSHCDLVVLTDPHLEDLVEKH